MNTTETIKQMIADGEDLDARVFNNNTFTKKKDYQLKGQAGNSALNCLLGLGRETISKKEMLASIELLVESGARVDIDDHPRYDKEISPLHHACGLGEYEAFEIMERHGDVNKRRKDGYNLLLTTVSGSVSDSWAGDVKLNRNYMKIVKHLLSNDSNFNMHNFRVRDLHELERMLHVDCKCAKDHVIDYFKREYEDHEVRENKFNREYRKIEEQVTDIVLYINSFCADYRNFLGGNEYEC